MKHIVSEHALATEKVMVEGACGQVEMQVYECGTSGAMIAIDGSWLEENDEGELFIPSPFNQGTAIQLIDEMEEKNLSTVCGEEHDKTLVDAILFRIKRDIEEGDYTALEELLQFLPEECLKNYK